MSFHAASNLVERHPVSRIRGFARKRRGEVGERVQVTFRSTKALKEYLASASEAEGLTQEDFIVAAIELDRDLAALLDGENARLKAFAFSLGVYLEEETAKVLADLIKRGLDCQDQPCAQGKAKKKP